MHYTIVPIIRDAPLTLGDNHLPLDGTEGEAWKKAIQALHPRLLPQLKESALLSEEESAFCVSGGIFDYERGKELVIDGTELRLSHCAENFLDVLMSPEECLQVIKVRSAELAAACQTDEQASRLQTLTNWWQNGWRVLIFKH
jgi:hypothetical protein